jgi:hypothetical protein
VNEQYSQEPKDKTINVADVSAEVVVTIRCLSAIPEEVEALLAEIAAEEQGARIK